MYRFLFDFKNFLNDRPITALALALASYVGCFLALIVATQSFPDRATEWAAAILSLFTIWTIRTGIPIVQFLNTCLRGGPRR